MSSQKKFITISKKLRKELLEKFILTQQGHPGSIFSIIDFLTVLYYEKFFQIKKDKLLMSKGHAAAALYPIMKDFGVLPKKEWDNWGKKKSVLRVFGNTNIPGIDMTSGSLAHGLGVAAGLVMADKKQKVYTIVSEGEFYEGSTWESLLFIKNYKLKNVKIIVDINNLIILGKTNTCLKLNPLMKKIEGLGLKCKSINGHNYQQLHQGCKLLKKNKIDCLILNTIKGKGFKIMENKPQWHYWNPLNKIQINKCMKEVS